MSKVTFSKSNAFFKTLKGKVDAYFINNDINISGDARLHIKGLFHIFTLLFLYVSLVFFTPPTIIALIFCAAFGINLALIGFNIMHEGGHHSFSDQKWINDGAAYSLNILGGNSYFWKIKHNVFHHTYTNIEGMDSDIELGPFLRLHANQPRYWIHKFQHIYCVLLYGISYFAWIFIQDFVKYFSGIVATGAGKQKIVIREHIIFWITKFSYAMLYVVIPILMVGFTKWIIGFSVGAFVCGLLIGIVFQLAHAVESTEFPTPDKETRIIEQEWAIHQVITTANFATKNKVVSWMLGGLNYQVEHHLFPKISHVHYPKINELVIETCSQFGISYNEYPSVFVAVKAHLSHLKELGRA